MVHFVIRNRQKLKFHAYVGQTGHLRKSAYQVLAERDKRYRSGPSPEKFFSLHAEGRRKPLEHVKGPGRPFFRYGEGYEDGGPGGPGESIEHLLFKEAIASLNRTRLSLMGHGDHRIIITHGETEKLIPGTSRAYRSDVYLRFTSEEPSELDLKWSGELYIEIHKTNLVEPGKHDEVRALGIPMVEVTIPATLLYRHGGAATTDELEQKYVQWLKGVLESDRGFVQGLMLSDPNSAPYLAEKLFETQAELDYERRNLAAAATELAKYKDTNKTLRQSLTGIEETADGLSLRLATSEEQALTHKKRVMELTQQLSTERRINAALAEQLTKFQLASVGMGLLATSLFLYLVWP
jgi:hypothetical protein